MIERMIGPKVTERWTIAKYDGDPPRPGEDKQPVEVVTFVVTSTEDPTEDGQCHSPASVAT